MSNTLTRTAEVIARAAEHTRLRDEVVEAAKEFYEHWTFADEQKAADVMDALMLSVESLIECESTQQETDE